MPIASKKAKHPSRARAYGMHTQNTRICPLMLRCDGEYLRLGMNECAECRKALVKKPPKKLRGTSKTDLKVRI